jgi:proline dehydrogenase
MLRKASLLLARQSWFRKLIMSTPVIREAAGRFVGGEDLASGLRAVRALNARGISGSLNFHGMHVEDPAEARKAADQAIEALLHIRDEGLKCHVSIKLTKIGLDIDGSLCRSELGRILDCAALTGGFVRIDMEEAVYVDETILRFEEAQARYGSGTVGLVVQSYLRDREKDLERLMDLGARVRLVKGGYRERRDLVFHSKAEVDAAFKRDIERLLTRGVCPAIATHDPDAVAWTKALRDRLKLGMDAFEFQMLYGVKPELQDSLVQEGFAVRCYIPYGGDWATHLAGCIRRIPSSLLGRAQRQGS